MSPGSRASSRRFGAWATLSAIPKRWRVKSVSGRLTFWYVCTLALSLGVFATFVLVVRAQTLRVELDSELAVRASSILADVAALLRTPDAPARLGADPELAGTPLLVRRGDGTVLFRSPAFPRLAADWERALAEPGVLRLSFLTVRDADGRDHRLVNRALAAPDGAIYALHVAMAASRVDRGVGELAVVQLVGILLVLAVARYGSRFTARRALSPIDEIVKRGRDIHGHQLGKRLVVEADTEEIERLVMTLNEMLDRLEEPVHTAHRFAANVSHELQTPITAMRFALEACQRTDRPPEYYREVAADLLLELDRLSTLIRDLRLLALAGAGRLVGRAEPVDVGSVAEECCEIGRAVAEEKQIVIDLQTEPGVVVAGSALHLRRAILNLTDNAVRYSPPRGRVDVRVGREHGAAFVSVQDQGCGIGDEDLARIFEPFYRADRARARETGGSGLGLSIAEQVVRAHGGRIDVASVPNEGSTFTIRLPLAAPAAIAV